MSPTTISERLARKLSSEQAANGAQETTRAPHREAWQRVLDEKLIEWGRRPEALREADFEPPTSEVVVLAAKVVRKLRDGGFPAPMIVVPNGEGGISFERKDGDIFEQLEVLSDLTVEILVFVKGRLVKRDTIPDVGSDG